MRYSGISGVSDGVLLSVKNRPGVRKLIKKDMYRHIAISAIHTAEITHNTVCL